MKGFKAFIMQGNVVDLAVGIIIGIAFGTVVKALVTDLITPIISIPGKTNFSGLKVTVRHSVFLYGDFLNALIAFVLVAGAVYFFVVKPVQALTARAKRGAPEEPPTTKDCPACLSTIPFAATRCAFCTTQLDAPAAA